jgi:hypothetical protein
MGEEPGDVKWESEGLEQDAGRPLERKNFYIHDRCLKTPLNEGNAY